jgi:hypothetical protein
MRLNADSTSNFSAYELGKPEAVVAFPAAVVFINMRQLS